MREWTLRGKGRRRVQYEEEKEEKRKRKEKKNRTLKTTRKKSLEKKLEFCCNIVEKGRMEGKYSLTNGPNNLKFYKNFSFFLLSSVIFFISLSLSYIVTVSWRRVKHDCLCIKLRSCFLSSAELYQINAKPAKLNVYQ